MSSLTLLVAELLVLVVVLVVVLLAGLAHRYPKAATPMLVGLGGITAIVTVVVPIVVRWREPARPVSLCPKTPWHTVRDRTAACGWSRSPSSRLVSYAASDR